MSGLRALALYGIALLAITLHGPAAACSVCRAHDGRPVEFRASVAIPDIALATIDRHGGEPLIYFNPHVILWLPLQLRSWIHAHECAHHVFGHLGRGEVTAAQEIEADCWATRELTARGMLSPADIELMEHAVAWLLPAHWMHMPGRFRAIELQKCTAYPVAAWWQPLPAPFPQTGAGNGPADYRFW